MVGKHSLLLMGLFLAACQPQSGKFVPTPILATATPLPILSTKASTDEALIQLAEEFQALRHIPGHFGGGDWHDDVDQWQGYKHQVMLALGKQLGNGEYGRSQLIALLGPSDHIVTGGNPLFDSIQSLPEYKDLTGSEEFLVYEWRSTHDFLFFAISNDQIAGSGWWYASE